MCERKAIESSFSTDRSSSTSYLGSACWHHFVVIHVDDAGTFQRERGKESEKERKWRERCLRLKLSEKNSRPRKNGPWTSTWNQLEFPATLPLVELPLHRYRRVTEVLLCHFSSEGTFSRENPTERCIYFCAESKFHCNETKWSF